jgi:hypothetical protein
MENNETQLQKIDLLDQLERESIHVDYEGRNYTVILRSKDFRENNLDPIHIYNVGFGLTDNISPLDNEQLKEAEKHKAQFIGVGISEIPAPYDSQSDRSDHPTSDIDARIILKALQTKNIPIESSQVVVSGYSEGASISVAMAGVIDQLQKKYSLQNNTDVPKNTLRLWSLTGVVDQRTEKEDMALLHRLLEKTSNKHIGKEKSNEDDTHSTGVSLLKQVIREFSVVGLYEIAERYKTSFGKDIPPLLSKKDIQLFIKDVFIEITKHGGLSFLRSQLEESKAQGIEGKGNFGNLLAIIGRCKRAENAWELLSQIRKMEVRNHICDSLSDNWNIKVAVPAHDTIYPWHRVTSTILSNSLRNGTSIDDIVTIIKEHSLSDEVKKISYEEEEKISTISKIITPHISQNTMEKLMKEYLFTSPNRVSLTIVGNIKSKLGEYDFSETHMGPANAASKYIESSKI